MKLKNRRTGEIGKPRIEYQEIYIDTENHITYGYKTLCDVFEDWEDYEEPKEYFTPTLIDNNIVAIILDEKMTRKEAEKTMEKINAWKRLKGKGFRVLDKKVIGEYVNVSYILNYPATNVEEKDLNLLFGGEE